MTIIDATAPRTLATGPQPVLVPPPPMAQKVTAQSGTGKPGTPGAPGHPPHGRTLVSVVIPALNEQANMAKVLDTIPHEALVKAGYAVEVVVVDNGSTDDTAAIAASLGARVIHQPERGYGNAYKAGFVAARGGIIATGDADCTYPFDALPALLAHLRENKLEFLSTNRLGRANWGAMKPSHVAANHALTTLSRLFFPAPFRDSQSGMWIFNRTLWATLEVRSDGMPFSQELKNEAYLKGYRCGETPIDYRVRGGEVKLNAIRDGLRNGSQLFAHRARARRTPLTPQNTPAVTITDAPAA